jgi:hypothetical protein
MNKSRLVSLVALAVGASLGLSTASQASITLTFEGLQNLEPIGNYYDGGLGGFGSGPGPNYGITFGPDSLAVIDSSSGGSGNTGNDPSGHTVAFFLSGPGDVMDVAGGFTTGFSFYYAAGQPGSVSVYSGLDGTGTLLATLSLSTTSNVYYDWASSGVSFGGTAESAIFSGTANFIAFDNITLGSATPGGAPEPSTWAMMLLGFAGLGFAGYRRARTSATHFAA